MNLYEWILIAISLFACIYASYTDLRSHRVSNVCTFGLIFLGFLIQLARILLGDQSTFAFLSLFLISGGIAFALYRLGVMGAGDAKLFWGFCLIVPSRFFQDMVGRPVFPPIVLSVNIFGVYFFGILAYLLVKSSKAQKRQLFQEFPWKEMPKRIVELVGFIGFGINSSAVFGVSKSHRSASCIKTLLALADFGHVTASLSVSYLTS